MNENKRAHCLHKENLGRRNRATGTGWKWGGIDGYFEPCSSLIPIEDLWNCILCVKNAMFPNSPGHSAYFQTLVKGQNSTHKELTSGSMAFVVMDLRWSVRPEGHDQNFEAPPALHRWKEGQRQLSYENTKSSVHRYMFLISFQFVSL